ncbi:MAG: class I SAM-dependent methyltransferase [Candidatus Thermoplasmatota archaeon]|nr:class I SAM-dependent methyltransferase [Candidatus Thermoplasmatota archaeon]
MAVSGAGIYQKYGEYYDLIYGKKNYSAEADGIKAIISKYAKAPNSILDFGCGTGMHALTLYYAGFEVAGVDISETMVEIAKKKAENSGAKMEFYLGDMAEINLEKKFDAVLCLFGAFGYLHERAQIIKFLKNVKKHLAPGGIFIFDFWHVPGFMRDFRPKVCFEAEKDGIRCIRISRHEFNAETSIFNADFDCTLIKGEKVLDAFVEKHKLRGFGIQEIKELLDEAGFAPLEFLDESLAKLPTMNTLNVTGVAKINR